MEAVMVMFFNWVDLWLAVTIILSFTPAGWRNRTGQLKPEGEKAGRVDEEKGAKRKDVTQTSAASLSG